MYACVIGHCPYACVCVVGQCLYVCVIGQCLYVCVIGQCAYMCVCVFEGCGKGVSFRRKKREEEGGRRKGWEDVVNCYSSLEISKKLDRGFLL